MSTKKITILLLILFLMAGCARRFRYSNESGEPYNRTFAIDKHSEVYARKLYTFTKEEPDSMYRRLTTDSTNTALAEVQYLIINKNKEALYISTLPTKYVDEDKETYLLGSDNSKGKDGFPNSFFFSTFYFGTYNATNNTLEFKNDKSTQRWQFTTVPEQRTITRRRGDTIITVQNKKFIGITKYNIKKRREFEQKKIRPHKIFASAQGIDESVANEFLFKRMFFIYLSFKIPIEESEAEKKVFIDKMIKADSLRIVYKNKKLKKIKYLRIPYNTKIYEDYKSIRFPKSNVIFDKQ